MATSEPLVPTGQAYGERQRFVGAARALDVPTSIPAAGGAPTIPPRPRQPGVVPPNFDVFAGRQPAQLGGEPVTNLDMRRQLLLEHPNPLYRDLAQRILS